MSGPVNPAPANMRRHPRYSTAAASEIVAMRSACARPANIAANPLTTASLATVSGTISGTQS